MVYKKSCSSVVGAFFLSCSAVNAGGYYGGNLAVVDYSQQGIAEDASLFALVGRLGYSFNDYLSIEARIGTGIDGDTPKVFEGGGDGDEEIGEEGEEDTLADVDLETMYGGYVRLSLASGVLSPYVIAGYTRGEVSVSIPPVVIPVSPGEFIVLDASSSESESDFSYGLGFDINLGETVTINAEYMRYFDKGGIEIGAFSLGAAMKF